MNHAALVLISFVAVATSAIAVISVRRVRKIILEMHLLGRANAELRAQLARSVEEDKTKCGWLDSVESDLSDLRKELEDRPRFQRKTYKLLTVGLKWTGKTSITLKWANPLINLGQIGGTKLEIYERTVSIARSRDTIIEHVFEIRDWGGEHIVDAMQELMTEEVHGLLIVVDLGGKDAVRVDTHRIEEQLKEFQPQALRFFFAPRILASCKTIVLFINKSDLIPGAPSEVEAKASAYYAPLINDLMKYSSQSNVRVLVGSASYGHNLHVLFSHLIERILPRGACDTQLLQSMRDDSPPITLRMSPADKLHSGERMAGQDSSVADEAHAETLQGHPDAKAVADSQ